MESTQMDMTRLFSSIAESIGRLDANVTQLKEYVKSLSETHSALDRRISALEKDRARVLGMAAAIGFVATLLSYLITHNILP